MCHVQLFGPALHAVGNQVSRLDADGLAFLDGILHCLVSFLGQIFLHLLLVEHVDTIVICQFV